MFVRKDADDIFHAVVERLEEHTPFTNMAPESRSRLIARAIAEVLGNVYRDMENLQKQAFPSTASSVFIDMHGELLGIYRYPRETDEQLKYRLHHALDAIGGRREAILAKARSVPLVKSVVDRPFTHGSGSFSLIVVPHAIEQIDAAVAAVEEAIQGVMAPGIRAIVRGPKVLPMRLELLPIFKEGLSQGSKDYLREAIQTTVKAYIDGLEMGSPFRISRLVHEVHKLSTDIQGVNVVSLEVSDQPLLVRDITCHWDEKFFVKHVSDIVVM